MWENKNGNYVVIILDDGTKIRLSDNPIPEYPESIDVKITNKCNAGCKFCHEKSTNNGKSFDLKSSLKLLTELPNGTELAIGGGNPLECKEELKVLFEELNKKGIITNLTINALHINNLGDLKPNAIGISYNKVLHNKIVEFYKKEKLQVVIHLIAGVHTMEELQNCLKCFDRVLILGYKKFGRGIDFYNEFVEKNLKDWKNNIGLYLNGEKNIIVFDNLSVKQLDIQRFFTKEKWNEIYMGDDGQFTMYLDLVENKFSVSSRSKEKFDIGNLSIKEMFNKFKK